MKVAQHLLVFALRIYRGLLSPVLAHLCGPGCGCRFSPTCSTYALAAVQSHGAWRGSWLAAKRIGRCHPWGGAGYDPVPPASQAIGQRPGASAWTPHRREAASAAATPLRAQA